MSCFPLELHAAARAEALMATWVEHTIFRIGQANDANIILKLLRGHVKDFNHQILIMKRHVGVLAVIRSSYIPLRVVDSCQSNTVVILDYDRLLDMVSCVLSLSLVSVLITSAVIIFSGLKLIVDHDQKA